jgi:hypothetical protein
MIKTTFTEKRSPSGNTGGKITRTLSKPPGSLRELFATKPSVFMGQPKPTINLFGKGGGKTTIKAGLNLIRK